MQCNAVHWKKMAYLVSSVSCQCLCAVFWPFQRDLMGLKGEFHGSAHVRAVT